MLVQSHLHHAPKLAAGVAALPSVHSAFAATQAAWRFLHNERVSLSALIQPLREVGLSRAQISKAPFVLLIHDWSKLRYDHPKAKRDLAQLTHQTDVGYELTTALLIEADEGSPLAPLEIHLKTAQGMLSTRDPTPEESSHLDQVLPTMQASRLWGLSKPIVHVIDREADSVDHFRGWEEDGHRFLVRADNRRVQWNGRSCLLTEIRRSLLRQKTFRPVGEATYQGQEAQLWVVETPVVLDRPAKKNVRGRKYERPGAPLSLRFLVAQVRGEGGRVLGEWMLLSNVPREWAATEHLARGYYWRWRIESFFKLLKSHGQQLEEWRQETGPAIARRLLVAAMACVVVWELEADDSRPAREFKDVLVRLSGRQTKRKRPHTAPALLAGLWILLSMLALLEVYDLRRLKSLASQIHYLDTS